MERPGPQQSLTVAYRGGEVSFRIPAGWVEEKLRHISGLFHPPGDGSVCLEFQFERGVLKPGETLTADTARSLLLREAEEHRKEVVSLANGAAMLSYDKVLFHEVSAYTRVWRIVQTLPPNQVRLLAFRFAMAVEVIARPDVAAAFEFFSREIPACVLLPAQETPSWN